MFGGRVPGRAYDPAMSARRVVVLCIAACLAASGSTAQAAPKPPKVPKIKTRIAKVQIDVSGFVETKVLHDTASDCFPGEHWVQTNRYEFDTGRFVNVSMRRITGDGFDPIVTSPFSISGGTASVEGKITEYRTTNYCNSTPGPVKPSPTCSSTSGRTSISMQEAPLVGTGNDDDPTPLTSNPLMIAIKRVGGGRDHDGCIGPGGANTGATANETTAITTSIAPGVSVVVPSGVSVLKMFNIRPRQTIRRTISITGTCAKANVSPHPGSSGPSGAPQPAADSDCTLGGKVTYTIRPRPKY